MVDPHDLIERACDMADDCKCPCAWGYSVSPAVSYGIEENEFALSCIDCGRSTEFRAMRSESDVAGIAEEWRQAVRNG